MKYLRALVILIAGAGFAPAAMAYIEILAPSAFTWERTVDRETGEDTFGLFLNPSVSIHYSFPDLTLDLENPLAAPLTLALDNPDWVNFYDGINTDYRAQVVNAQGSVTYDVDLSIKDWNLTMDLILSESWYGNFSASGTLGSYANAQLVLNYDDFQPRHFIEPYDITEFYSGFLDGFWITARDTSLPEPGILGILMSGLAVLFWTHRSNRRLPDKKKYV